MKVRASSGVFRSSVIVVGLLVVSGLLVIEGQAALVSRFVQPEGGSFRSVNPNQSPLEALDQGLSLVVYGLFPLTALLVGTLAGALTKKGFVEAVIGLGPLWFAIVTGGPGGGIQRSLHVTAYLAVAVLGILIGRRLKRGSTPPSRP